jgi:hypothetical protein
MIVAASWQASTNCHPSGDELPPQGASFAHHSSVLYEGFYGFGLYDR